MGARGTGPGRRRGLNRGKVIEAAVEVIERDGLDAFSLRRLADELGVEAMSLYNHVPNKDALLTGVAEALLAEIDYSAAATGTWQERLRAHAAAFRSAAQRHPRAFPLVLTRPTQSAAALGIIRSALAILDELGLEPKEQVHVLRSCTAFIVGTIMRELGSAITLGTIAQDVVEQRVVEIGAEDDPILGRAAPHLAVSDHDVEFSYGIELLITALAARTGMSRGGGAVAPSARFRTRAVTEAQR
ncbi:TetR/AcrR family transcriptional regulator C-terminal domain-containing protein [Streptomyces sp. NPDC090303]|uniref:TetR/AcrR family transcriptional regulator C-terminal domain-containing protein n=1 Tax=Streptomyces sp. NPDC090303 TaxID=3365960 RepID=UPI003812A3AC